MKTVFTISTGCDGLQNACFTNIKAIHEFLSVEQGLADGNLDINAGVRIKLVPYSYSNLVKVIRMNQNKNQFHVATIYSEMFEDISINELGILSK